MDSLSPTMPALSKNNLNQFESVQISNLHCKPCYLFHAPIGVRVQRQVATTASCTLLPLWWWWGKMKLAWVTRMTEHQQQLTTLIIIMYCHTTMDSLSPTMNLFKISNHDIRFISCTNWNKSWTASCHHCQLPFPSAFVEQEEQFGRLNLNHKNYWAPTATQDRPKKSNQQ